MIAHMASLSRRRFLGGAGVLGGLALGCVPRPASGQSRPRFSDHPFKLGVASGDPAPDGVVLWTRLAPDPLAGGGMPEIDVPVDWQIAEDERFRRIVQRGKAVAQPGLAHSVH